LATHPPGKPSIWQLASSAMLIRIILNYPFNGGCESVESVCEQLDEPKKTPQVSTAMELGILAAYLTGAFGSLFLSIVLGDRPFGIQITTLIAYTYFAFWYVFFPTRGMLEKYSLRNKTVQQQIPLLLAIHCAFLIFIFLGQTVLFAMKPRLPSYWLTEHGSGRGRGTLYEFVLIASFTIVFFTQVLISRGILSHSLKEALNKSGPGRIDLQDKD
jgi:hypothetical protein